MLLEQSCTKFTMTSSILYSTILYCTVLYYTVLYYIVMYVLIFTSFLITGQYQLFTDRLSLLYSFLQFVYSVNWVLTTRLYAANKQTALPSDVFNYTQYCLNNGQSCHIPNKLPAGLKQSKKQIFKCMIEF